MCAHVCIGYISFGKDGDLLEYGGSFLKNHDAVEGI